MRVTGTGFIGRQTYLDELSVRLARTKRGAGEFVLLRGRRQVGKSRLVTEFLARSGVRSVYFQASRRPGPEELRSFTEAVGRSNVAGADLVRSGLRFGSWESALEWTAGGATVDAPVVVVIDELPYLIDADPAFESVIQRVWDQTLQYRPVLLIVVGSDLATMEALSSYDRPLFGRLSLERAVLPLHLAEVADLLGLTAPEAVDAYLTVGGFPRVLLSWPQGASRQGFLREALADSTSPLVVVGERMLAAEFPSPDNARSALLAVGHGERSFSSLSNRSGLGATSLHRVLDVLRHKRVVDAENPLSTARGARATRYRVTDPYLRYWLRFVGPALGDIERGRGDLALAGAEGGWLSYRGRAVEPLVRHALERLAPLPGLGTARDFGGYWTRANDVEVDLVGVSDRSRVDRVAAVGSIKWRETEPFSPTDERELRRVLPLVPGADERTDLLAVARAGFAPGVENLRHIGPADLVRAWT